MQTPIAFLPFILLFTIYVAVSVLDAAYVKLSGKILHGSFVSWQHAFIFALAITAFTLIGQTLSVAAGLSVPLILAVVFNLVLHLTFGGWFFSTRGITKHGQLLGWSGGVRIGALAFLFLLVTGALANSILHVLVMAIQS